MVSEEGIVQKEDEMKRGSEEEQGSSNEEEEEEEEEIEDNDKEDEEEEETHEGCRRGENKVARDIRRYYCEFCGICRSKKALIAAHVVSHHKEKMVQKKVSDEEQRRLQTTCSECGKSFSKPAYLRQHMQSHSLERPFACPIYGCHCCYRRKDHLLRHLLTHEGKIFVCPVENCSKKFNVQGNMKRHVEELHSVDIPFEQKKDLHVCCEFGCGKVFKYASKLRKHEDSHVKLDSVEVICSELGCGKFFSSTKCLKEHIQFSHRYIP